ncbi:KLP1 Kinesin heavy chain [Candida maltosa Xu316]
MSSIRTKSFDGDYDSSQRSTSTDFYDDTPNSPFNFLSPSQGRNSAFSLDSSITTINNIKVICRFRPENDLELQKGKNIVEFPNNQTLNFHGKDYTCQYTFDKVFGPQSSQSDIYQFSIAETVDDLINGYNGTVLAYGQTGSGKSYTMLGKTANISEPQSQGIIPRISHEIFERVTANELASSEVEYSVEVSFMEIHLERIKDLIDIHNNNEFADHKFTIHEDKLNGIYVKGLAAKSVTNELELLNILNNGLKYRSISSTNMNEESSRSHTIFQIKLTQKHIETETIKRSNLFLVDLAGSEKIDKTGAQGQTLEEAKKINSSLSALGNVINALTDGKSTHIPYRDSKLTRILQESIGGNSRTSLIINCSPSSLNELETLSTLRFGTRAKSIKNSAHVNTELSTVSLKNRINQLEKINQNNQSYIKQLEEELSSYRSEPTSSPSMFSLTRNSTATTTSLATSLATKPSTATFQSRLPMPSTATTSIISSPPPSMKATNLQLNDELDRRDKKIDELENVILNLKMQNLKTSHQEESKLFSLENSLHNISNKLNEVELVNINLRKHLLISEKIIESRDNKINKLKASLKDQQLLISRETLGFRNRLGEIQSKLEDLNKYKEEEISIKRETLLLQRQKSIASSHTGMMRDSINSSNDDIQSISEIIPDPELIDSSFDDKDHSRTLVNSTSSDLKRASHGESLQEGFSIYSSKKLDDNDDVNFQQEFISISDFLKESRRRSLLMAPPPGSSNTPSTMASPAIPQFTDLDSSDTSGMFGSSSKAHKTNSLGLNLKIVKPLRSNGGGSLGIFQHN